MCTRNTQCDLINDMELLCPWETPNYLIFSSNIPAFLYYSHFVAILAAVIFSIALIGQYKNSLSIKLFLFATTFFTAWTIIDVLLWASNRPDLVMFYWSLQILLEIFIFSSTFYFAYAFITKKDLPLWSKAAMIVIVMPIILLLPTKFILPGIDISYCNAIESEFLFYYLYIYEIILSFIIFVFAIREFRRSPQRKKEISLFTAGIFIYLMAFSSGNIIGSYTGDWSLAQIGLFGMPVFIGFLTYLVVKFKSFNLKLIGAQMIVAIIWILTLSILFVRRIESVRYITVFTLFLFTVLGYQLIKSVKKEIEIRERIEILAKDLEKANIRLKELDQQKSEFISLASHQLRGPLTAIKGYSSLILEGDCGPVSADVKNSVETIYKSTEALVVLVGDYLDVSRIEQGRMQYDYSDFDVKILVDTVINEMTPNINLAGLDISFEVKADGDFMIHADQGKIKQVIINIIDNAIKYTKAGSIKVTLSKDNANKKLLISIKDTGVGIPKEILPRLFEKFTRAQDANKTNIMGTGLGLYVAKKMIEAHNGKIWAESEGKGKGSNIFIELLSLNANNLKKVDPQIEKFVKEL